MQFEQAVAAQSMAPANFNLEVGAAQARVQEEQRQMQESMLLHRQQLAAEHQAVVQEAATARSEMAELQHAWQTMTTTGSSAALATLHPQSQPQQPVNQPPQPVETMEPTQEEWCLSPQNPWRQS